MSEYTKLKEERDDLQSVLKDINVKEEQEKAKIRSGEQCSSTQKLSSLVSELEEDLQRSNSARDTIYETVQDQLEQLSEYRELIVDLHRQVQMCNELKLAPTKESETPRTIIKSTISAERFESRRRRWLWIMKYLFVCRLSLLNWRRSLQKSAKSRSA